jgi:hypothetical protein
MTFLHMVGAADAGSPYLSLIAAMITPVFFIVASGSMVGATLTRLVRVTDRARALIAVIRDDHDHDKHSSEVRYMGWLENYRRRSLFVERALISYYCAIGLFIATSLGIAFSQLLHDFAPWFAVVTVVGGACSLLLGTIFLLGETILSSGQLRDEIKTVADHIGHDLKASAAEAIAS